MLKKCILKMFCVCLDVIFEPVSDCFLILLFDPFYCVFYSQWLPPGQPFWSIQLCFLQSVIAEAQLLKQSGVHVIAVGVGKWLDEYELNAIASYPYSVNTIILPDRDTLFDARDRVKALFCNGESVDHNTNIKYSLVPLLCQHHHTTRWRHAVWRQRQSQGALL